MTTLLKIEGMTCGHCVSSVKQALEAISGVTLATVNLPEGNAIVEHGDGVTPQAMMEAVREEGYSAQVAK